MLLHVCDVVRPPRTHTYLEWNPNFVQDTDSYRAIRTGYYE